MITADDPMDTVASWDNRLFKAGTCSIALIAGEQRALPIRRNLAGGGSPWYDRHLMKRRWGAFFLTLAFAGPLAAPLVATVRDGCGRCAGAARCCCAPSRRPGGCGLARPCAPAAGSEGVTAPHELERALPESPVTTRMPPAPPQTVRADSPFEPAELPPVPPDPPPRAPL